MKRTTTPLIAIILLLLTLPLASCTGFDVEQLLPPVAPTSGPTPERSDHPFATATPDANDSSSTSTPLVETPGLACSPPVCAPGELFRCTTGDCTDGCGLVCVTPTPITGPLAPAPTEWENLEGWLSTLWLGNVDPATVRAALQQAGLQKSQDDWAAADFDGDLRDEWVLVLYDRSLPGLPFGEAGDLWVVGDDGVIFRYYTAPSADIYEFLAPTVISITDMTGDGRPELITDTPLCGASTCYNNYRVIGLRDGHLSDLVAPHAVAEDVEPTQVISVSYADTRIEDFDADGLPELVIHGGTLGSAGAGIVRPRTEVWGYDGSAVVHTETILDPTNYRHHILFEANDLMASGDMARALPLYEAVINDDTLSDDGFILSPEQGRADASAFAAFRLILIDRMISDWERAASRLAWLQATYPESAATGAAEQLILGWSTQPNAAALCELVEADLAALENPTGVLADTGYGNPGIGAADFCP